jgi:glycosyltransferase involved in cell wall biosynthesis
MDKVRQSMLNPAIVESRVIPNGVDLTVFHSDNQQLARAELGLPQNAKVLLFTGRKIKRSSWKDYVTMRDALVQVAARGEGKPILFIALGEDAPSEQIGRANVCFIPYQKDPHVVARYYQAADIYVHAAKAETFPNTILEALACGTPVIATAVGGIPEQVKGLWLAGCKDLNSNKFERDESTGVLVKLKDVKGMAMSIERLLDDKILCRQLGENAVQDSNHRFDLLRQVEAYLKWFKEIVELDVPRSSFLNRCVAEG